MQTNLQRDVLVLNLEKRFEEMCGEMYGKTVAACDNGELYYALLNLVKELSLVTERLDGEKKVYYISMEFLIGKLLSNHLIIY